MKRNIRKAVLSGREKSLGPHLFVLASFQKVCGIVKDDLMTVWDFHDIGIVNCGCNSTFCLIIKCECHRSG